MAIQLPTQPIMDKVAAFDARNIHEFTFNVIGGAQIVSNRLVITNNITNEVVYDKTIDTFTFVHEVPANTLSNYNEENSTGYYNVVVYTIDNAGNQSIPSTPVVFYCYSTPSLTIVDFSTIEPESNIVKNSSYQFQANYIQIEGELLNTYKFVLYDSNKEEISNSGLIYYAENSDLEYTFSGMSDNTQYYIEVQGQTVNDTIISSGLVQFSVQYIQPASFAIVELENNCEGGYIQIKSNIKPIDGKTNPDPATYIEDKEIDLTENGSWVEWSEGYTIEKDFTMRIWGRDFNPNTKVLEMSNQNNSTTDPNRIEMYWIVTTPETTEKAYIILKCYYHNSVPYVISSNVIDRPEDTKKVFIWVRRVNDLFDLQIENLG